ncbi:MAG: hypothetical protein ACTHYN_12015 [Marinobacter sp.]|uniref:hypothetical protein n=1 Tax=Marinobacter sp. TaxID=50741 RepID=UPI003F985708
MTITATDTFSQSSNTYTQGELIRFDLIITNTGVSDVSFMTGDGCLADYEIFDENMSSIGFVPRACAPVIPTATPLNPGATLSESVTWSQETDSEEAQLPIGTYTITAEVWGHEKNASIKITII